MTIFCFPIPGSRSEKSIMYSHRHRRSLYCRWCVTAVSFCSQIQLRVISRNLFLFLRFGTGNRCPRDIHKARGTRVERLKGNQSLLWSLLHVSCASVLCDQCGSAVIYDLSWLLNLCHTATWNHFLRMLADTAQLTNSSAGKSCVLEQCVSDEAGCETR